MFITFPNNVLYVVRTSTRDVSCTTAVLLYARRSEHERDKGETRLLKLSLIHI